MELRGSISRACLLLPLVLLLGACQSPREQLRAAMELVEEGQYEEGILALQQLEQAWPGRPEASAAAEAVPETRMKAAVHFFDAGDHGAVARMLDALGEAQRAKVIAQRPGVRWVPKVFRPGVKPEVLAEVVAAAEAPETLKELAADKLCPEATRLAPVCKGDGVEPGGLAIAEALATLEKTEAACRLLEAMKGRCQGELGFAIAGSLDAKFPEALRERIAVLEKRLPGRLAAD